MVMDIECTQADMIEAKSRAEFAAAAISKAFRAQPIVDASLLGVVGLELLFRARLNFNDRRAMLQADIEAIQAASLMAACGAYKYVHCNVEILSLIDPEWIEAMAMNIKPGVVIEVVERNGLMMKASFMGHVKNVIDLARSYGGAVAMDDVVFNDHNIFIMENLQPDIIKVENIGYIRDIRVFSSAKIVVERVETREMARHAKLAGAECLQGYYCDIEVENDIPARLTPPGVVARQQQLALERNQQRRPVIRQAMFA